MGVPVSPSYTRTYRFLVMALLIVFAFTLVRPGGRAVAADEETTRADPAQHSADTDENIIAYISRSVGYFFLALGPVSVALVALIVLLAMDLRMSSSIPPDFVDEFTDTVNKRKFKEAFELARNENSFLGRVLTAGMGRLQYGLEDAREATFNTVESVKASKEQLLTYLAVIGTLGPMIGLVGTVYGMIRTFMVLGKGGAQDPARLAKGISEALAITLLGIGLAVPAIFFHAFFRNRLIRISMDSANLADELLTQMYHFSRRPAPAETRAAPATATPVAEARPAVKPAG